MADMPYLSDFRRVVRMAMVMDEVRQISQCYMQNKLDKIRTVITPEEFIACGGARGNNANSYSFYRQLVHAKRDANAYAQRGIFPAAGAIKQARKIYTFYDTDEENVVEDAPLFDNDGTMDRVAYILYRFRKAVRGLDIGSAEARNRFMSIQLTKDDFVLCGGHRSVANERVYSFYRQVVFALRDIRRVLERAHGYNCKDETKVSKKDSKSKKRKLAFVTTDDFDAHFDSAMLKIVNDLQVSSASRKKFLQHGMTSLHGFEFTPELILDCALPSTLATRLQRAVKNKRAGIAVKAYISSDDDEEDVDTTEEMLRKKDKKEVEEVEAEVEVEAEEEI